MQDIVIFQVEQLKYHVLEEVIGRHDFLNLVKVTLSLSLRTYHNKSSHIL